jgi:hypothetical protein
MTLFSFSLMGSIVALVVMTASFVWLHRRGKFLRSDMTEADAIDFVQDRVANDQNGIVVTQGFRGRAWGMGMSAEIETREVLEMVRQGRYAEAGPWLGGILARLARFCSGRCGSWNSLVRISA